MNAEFLFGIVLIGGFILLLCAVDGLLNLLYLISPKLRKWINNYCDSLPEWDKGGYLNEWKH